MPAMASAGNNHACRRSVKLSAWMQAADSTLMKAAIAVNNRSSRFGCESFVPQILEAECDKAARIVARLSYKPPVTETTQTTTATSLGQHNVPAPMPQHYPVTISPANLSSALAVAIFTTARLGLGHISGSTGSGVVVGRRSDGTWGLPSAIRTLSLGAGPLAAGAEVTDRIYVIHTPEALDRFLHGQFHFGPEVVLAAGPHGGGAGISFAGRWSAQNSTSSESERSGVEESNTGKTDTPWNVSDVREVGEKEALLEAAQDTKPSVEVVEPSHPPEHSHEQHRGGFDNVWQSLRQPAYCYMRSRGLYAGFQGEGTIVLERVEANEAVYDRPVSATEIINDSSITIPVRETARRAIEGLQKALSEAARDPVACE